MLRVLVLGAAAGGGFPQWNSNNDASRRARSHDPAALSCSQSSIAVSADGARWLLCNASPDIRQQIKNLTGDHFLSTTPWTWLEHYPRYFQAITLRLEKLTSTPVDQERQMREVLAEWWKVYADLQEKHAQLAIVDPELDQLRWMIEEYRVSLFAQQLGTSLTVSAKRLEKQLKKVRQG